MADGELKLGFGVAAGLDPAVAGELGEICAGLGYGSLWSNDHPAASGLETVASFAESAPGLDLGIGALALDRHTPERIATTVGELGLEPGRLMLAFGSGFSKHPLATVREGVAKLRAALPDGVRLLVAAMGPKMCALAGEIADGVMLNWMTAERAHWARERIEGGARRAGRLTPEVVGYVRVAVDERAQERLAKEETFYRQLHRGYISHFQKLGSALGTVGVADSDSERVAIELSRFEGALDVVVVRALASATVESMGEVAKVAADA